MESYASGLRIKMLAESAKRPCCRRALTYGILLSSDTNATGTTVRREVQTFSETMIREQFGRTCHAEPTPSGRRVRLVCEIHPAERALEAFDNKPILSSVLTHPCNACSAAFLRGLFIGCGHVMPPEKGYCLELTAVAHTDAITAYLSGIGLEMRNGIRFGERYLYTKRSEQIEDFFARAGMPDTAFTFMNEKIERDFRNSANRIASCESNNIARTVTAAGTQIDWIERLADAGKLSMLPEELQMTAAARLADREASLAHLAATMVPPLTKSGLNHRLQKIVACARQLLGADR